MIYMFSSIPEMIAVLRENIERNHITLDELYSQA